jgi:hypothetical protein
MKEVDVVNTARSINYLTGAKSRGQGTITPSGMRPLDYDPFNTKKELMKGHGNIVAGLGGERPIFSAY